MLPDQGAEADSGKGRAGDPAFRSAPEVPLYAEPGRFCLRFLPERHGTRFCVQILDVRTGDILDEQPPQDLAELPAVMAQMASWVAFQ